MHPLQCLCCEGRVPRVQLAELDEDPTATLAQFQLSPEGYAAHCGANPSSAREMAKAFGGLNRHQLEVRVSLPALAPSPNTALAVR